MGELAKPKIYLFINSGRCTDWVITSALSEDGEFLAGHCSSNDWWAQHDIGLKSEWKHDIYQERYPDGFELEWVDNPKQHAGLMAAHARHLAAGDKGTEWQRARAIASEEARSNG